MARFFFLVALLGAWCVPGSAEDARKPNIIFILADDLGYGELGCYGQKIIQTPRIDRMAAEGLRFTQFYAGSTVCAPSRSVLMTGQHVGVPPPREIQSISMLPALLGEGKQRKHEYLYWEFYERGVSQAVLLEGRWKGIRLQKPSAPIQLYDLAHDLGEKDNIASRHPALVERISTIMVTTRVDNAFWKMPESSPVSPAR